MIRFERRGIGFVFFSLQRLCLVPVDLHVRIGLAALADPQLSFGIALILSLCQRYFSGKCVAPIDSTDFEVVNVLVFQQLLESVESEFWAEAAMAL